jgi:RNA polymerase sigma-70 factor (ECF subfamily)
MDAEEVMQDAMIKYLKSGMSLELPKEEAWLVKSTVRGAIDRLRKKKRDLEFLEEYKADSIENMGNVKWGDGAEMVPKIKEGIARLPDGYRAVLSMILFEGFDYEEVAQIMEVKESTVRSQYMRGKERLIEIINEL